MRKVFVMKRNGRFLSILLCCWVLVACGGVLEDVTPIPPPPTLVGLQPTTAPGGATATAVSGEGIVATVTAVSTPGTPIPTPTLASTATATAVPATPITDPPIQAVAAFPLPSTSRSLLFIADGSLKLWNHQTRQVTTLLPRTPVAEFSGGPEAPTPLPPTSPRDGEIWRYEMSKNGRFAITTRILHNDTTSEAPPDVQLAMVDLATGQNWVVMPTTPSPWNMALAPDGKTLAYINPSPGVDIAFPQSVYLLDVTSAGKTAREVAQCTGRCGWLVWNPDSNLVVWSDEAGLWLYNLTASQPEFWLPNPDSATASLQILPLSWWQNGRYVLAWYGGFPNQTLAVLDIPTKKVVVVPGFRPGAGAFDVEASWMQDGRLLVSRQLASGPTLELWRATPEEGQINLEETLTVSNEAIYITAATHTIDGRFAYTLMSGLHTPTDGFYLLTSLTEQPERVNAIIPNTTQREIAWLPDGSGAVATFGLTTVYAPADDSALYDVTALLGEYAHNFSWLP